MSIWSEAYLNRLSADAEVAIVNEIDCIFHRFSISTTAGTSLYTLPDYVRKIIAITWKGKRLDSYTYQELARISTGTALVDNTTKTDAAQSIPLGYCCHPSNLRSIRFYPCPSESILADDTNILGSDIENRVIVSCWRTVDNTAVATSIPPYILRRTQKAYVLWKAFAKEGKGQNLKASEYHRKKFEFLIQMFKDVNNKVFIAKHHILGDGYGWHPRRPARPQLPPDYPAYRE